MSLIDALAIVSFWTVAGLGMTIGFVALLFAFMAPIVVGVWWAEGDLGPGEGPRSLALWVASLLWITLVVWASNNTGWMWLP